MILYDYKILFDEFCKWVEGIEEDDPLPPEIEYIYFVLSSKNGLNTLQYGGNENKQKVICSFDYFPLEAQFFYSNIFIELTKSEAITFFETMKKDIFNNENLSNMFKNKHIWFICLK